MHLTATKLGFVAAAPEVSVGGCVRCFVYELAHSFQRV